MDYLTHARASLDAFDAAANALKRVAETGSSSPQRRKCRETVAALLPMTEKLRFSLTISETTAADIANLQGRLEGQTRDVARALKQLGEALRSDDAAKGAAPPPIDATLRDAVIDLEEAAQRVAAAIFPSAVKGLREVNTALMLELPLVRLEYDRAFDESSRALTAKQREDVEKTAAEVFARFDAVNALLNDLFTAPLVGDGDAAENLVEQSRAELKAAVKRARSKAAGAFKPFHSALGKAEALADKVAALFDDLRVPVFPAPNKLDAFSKCIDRDLYRSLAGVERFALMNIGARIQSIPLSKNNPETLASPRFEIRVFKVFPDRLYFTAKAEFIAAVEALVKQGAFVSAPAGLHKYNKGSFKQKQGDKGNLQVSYAPGTEEDPGDLARVRVDADIDLYRGTVAHLFGEVLVNHLTGSKTDQFKVFDILVENKVPALGGFEVISV